MAFLSYTDDLICSICLTFFDDPVSLPVCGHSFCRKCVTNCLSTSNQCPHCNETLPTDEKYLPTNHTVKRLVEKAKEAAKLQCSEHEEKLKLFCETDQQLACVICRDGEKHKGHTFKPIKEAVVSLMRELKNRDAVLENLRTNILAIEKQVQAQREEITKTKKWSSHLITQINAQFEELYQFMMKRKEEIKKELKEKEREAVEKMSENLKAMETALSDCKVAEAKARSCLEMTDPEKFLQSWTEGTGTKMPKSLLISRAAEFQVNSSSISLGPYESHLQFFVWKEMLEVVKPLPERITVKSDNSAIKISPGGRSLFWSVQQPQKTTERVHGGYGSCTTLNVLAYVTPTNTNTETLSASKFNEGQHYWEIEVCDRAFWELGVLQHFLRYDGQQYSIYHGNALRNLTFPGRLQKIGIYLNCSSKQLCFYDATNMKHVDTITSTRMYMPVSPYFNLGVNNGIKEGDCNPLTVCWY